MDDFKQTANYVGERLLKGAPSALEEVIDLYQKRIYNLAFRFTGDQEEACDLSQEIFLRLYNKIHHFSPNTDFNAWFMRLAVNAAINYRSKTRKNPSHIAQEFNDHNPPHSALHTQDHWEKTARLHSIHTLLTHLPGKERMVITLQLWEKKKLKEIADLMDTSVKSVEALLTRARKRLKKIIEKNEGF